MGEVNNMLLAGEGREVGAPKFQVCLGFPYFPAHPCPSSASSQHLTPQAWIGWVFHIFLLGKVQT